MIEKVVICTRPDGGVSIVVPSPNGHATVEAEPARVERRMVVVRTLRDREGNLVELKAPQDVRVPAKRRKETDDELLQRIMREGLPAGAVDARVVERRRIPSDRTFRNAWRQSGREIVVDMALAREIHREAIRERRKPMLEALDRDYIRADERRDTPERERIIALKNKLRDAPADPRIDAAATPEALKAVDPLA